LRYVHLEGLQDVVRQELEKIRQEEEPVIFLEKGLTVGLLMVLPPKPFSRGKTSRSGASIRRRRSSGR